MFEKYINTEVKKALPGRKPTEVLTATKEIKLCNAINIAIAHKRIVMADDMRIAGAIPNHGTICCILHEPWQTHKVPFIWLDGQTIH
jgi:hypothetical protein